MNEATLIALAVAVLAWAMVSEWLAARNVTGPVVLMAAGLLLANPSWGLVSVEIGSSTVHHLAEVTLALLLFADASAVPVAAARHDLPVTARLLGIGLPLTILAGTGLALLLFPNLELALAGLIATSLAPTDAALSAAVIADERLPVRVRRILNVESGLNDGIVTPAVTFCLGAAAAVLDVVGEEYDSGFGAAAELGIGLGVGVVIAFLGARILSATYRRGWMEHGARRLGTLALALLAFLVASALDGNPFVAAFVGGLVFGAVERHDAATAVELTARAGGALSLVLWFLFGAGFVLPALEQLDLARALYAVASLTVVRMVPVAIALIGSGQDRPTTLFVGWFGPRGLASVVFGLLAVEELGVSDPGVQVALQTIALTIVLSVVAHGISARPLTTRYVRATSAR